MPFNGAGVYSPITSPDFPAVSGSTIRASQYNNQILDMATALTNCMTRDGQAPATAAMNMGGYKVTNMAAGAASTDAVNYGQLLGAFPVGAIYFTETNTNPGTFIGGTWTQIAAGRVLIGVGTLGSDTYAGSDTGGEARHALTTAELPAHDHGGVSGANSANHTHTISISDPGHNHVQTVYSALSDGGNKPIGFNSVGANVSGPYSTGTRTTGITASSGDNSVNHTHTISSQGSGTAHENRPPYLAVYIWKRTA